MMKPQTFEEGMAVLAATYPSIAMSDKTLIVWKILVDDLDEKAFMDSILSICRSTRDIYPGTNIVAMIREGVYGTAKDASVIALAEVEKAFRSVGAYSSIAFSDPLIMVAITRMGGWTKLCSISEDEWKFARKDFLRLYEASTREAIDINQVPKALPGIHEVSNEFNGHGDRPVTLKVIGATENKKQIGEGEK